MPIPATPRSVSDATRFTAATPHASSKAALPRFAAPRSGAAATSVGGGSSGNDGPGVVETPEQRVARLRAAHRRAKEAQVSKFDKVVDAGRRVFDSVHKITVFGLVIFTGVAVVGTAYTAYDMLRYNRRRTSEWVEAQKKLEADSLEAARIAYMTGKATEEQIALVEEQLERERESGRKTSFFSGLNVLEPAAGPKPSTATTSSFSPASPTTTASASAAAPQRVTESVSWPISSSDKEDATASASQPENKKSGLWAWLTSNLKKEEEEGTDRAAASPSAQQQRRLGWESLSEEAHAAFEREKQNQRQGGPLDRVGIVEQPKQGQQQQQVEASAGQGDQQSEKKGWWSW